MGHYKDKIKQRKNWRECQRRHRLKLKAQKEAQEKQVLMESRAVSTSQVSTASLPTTGVNLL